MMCRYALAFNFLCAAMQLPTLHGVIHLLQFFFKFLCQVRNHLENHLEVGHNLHWHHYFFLNENYSKPFM